MKKNDWIYLANAMWKYAEKNEGRISVLIKQLIYEVNTNKEMIENDMDKNGKNVRSNGQNDTYKSNKNDFTGFAEL